MALFSLEVARDASGHVSRVGVRLVHGAYALVVWDPGAIYGYKKVTLT